MPFIITVVINTVVIVDIGDDVRVYCYMHFCVNVFYDDAIDKFLLSFLC